MDVRPTRSPASHRLPAPGKAALRHGRRAGALLSLFILLFNLVPAAAFPARIQDADAAFVVCTAEGTATVAGQTDGDRPAPQSTAGAHCVFCLPLAHGGLPVDGVSAVVMPPARLVGLIRPARQPPRPLAKPRGSVGARAPPPA